MFEKKPLQPKEDIQKETKTKKERVKTESKDGDYVQGKLSLSQRKLELDLERAEASLKLDQLKIEKMQGLLIPTDAVRTMNIFVVETIRTTFIQELDSIANIYCQILGATKDQFIEIRRNMAERVQVIMEDAKENLSTGTNGIVEDYREVRGRGESK